MPKKVENALKRQAAKKGLTGERKNAYVYGTELELLQRKQRDKKKTSS